MFSGELKPEGEALCSETLFYDNCKFSFARLYAAYMFVLGD